MRFWRTVGATNSPDNLVAAISEANGAILVTSDGDFKQITLRIGVGQQTFRKLSLVRFEKWREAQMAARIQTMMSLIKHEWATGNGDHDRRMFVVICGSVVRSHR